MTKSQSRDTRLELVFDETNVSKSVTPYLIDMTYTDSDEDDADDLQITIEDRDGKWRTKWLNDALKKAMHGEGKSSHLKIHPAIIRENWNGDGKRAVLDCGRFELDTIDMSGPPSIITMKATALSPSKSISATKRTKAWENYKLKGIAVEIAKKNGIGEMFLSSKNPKFKRIEQTNETDIAFLSRICKKSGVSLKCTNDLIVLFNKQDYQSKKAVGTIKYGDGKYDDYKCTTGAPKEKYTHVSVSCTKSDGSVISATYEVPDLDDEGKQKEIKDEDKRILKLTHQCSSVAEAMEYARQMAVRYNKFSKSITFNMEGNPYYVAGINLNVKGFGMFDGKYTINQATHTVSASGYTTSIQMTECV